MIQLCYISTARRDLAPNCIDDVLAASRRNNARDRVTGLLLFNGKRFLQILEGAPPLVEATYRRILVDRRHFAIVKLSERTIDAPEFGGWDMAFERFSPERGAVEAQVAALTGTASPSVKALFNSYVAI